MEMHLTRCALSRGQAVAGAQRWVDLESKKVVASCPPSGIAYPATPSFPCKTPGNILLP